MSDQIYTDEELFAALREDSVELLDEEIQRLKNNDGDIILEIGRVYYINRINDARAFAWYYRAALLDYADAQYRLGWMYRCGQGVSIDHVKALQWYTKAAEKGHADAQNDVGFMLDNGLGAPKDTQAVIEWYTKAAGNGSPQAMNNLGVIYEREFKDMQKSVNWYQKAALKNLERGKYKVKELNKMGYFAQQEE